MPRQVPQLQPGIWGGPSSLGVTAANSLYRLDATAADEGAAGRPEVQEGQAGRSGQSGLATGTENRKEMNRVKRRRERSQSIGGEGAEEGGKRGSRGGGWGYDTGAPSDDTHPGGQGGPEPGFEAADVAEREDGGWRTGKGHLALGEVEKWVLPRPRSERREQRTGEKGKSQSGKAGPQ